jgi:hypothetical protein
MHFDLLRKQRTLFPLDLDPQSLHRLPPRAHLSSPSNLNLQPPPLPRTLERELDNLHRQRRLLRLDDQRFLVLSDGGVQVLVDFLVCSWRGWVSA